MKNLIVRCPQCGGDDVQVELSSLQCLNGKCRCRSGIHNFLVQSDTSQSDTVEAFEEIALILDNEPFWYSRLKGCFPDRQREMGLGVFAGQVRQAVYARIVVDGDVYGYLEELLYRGPFKLLLEHYSTKRKEGVF